MSGGGLRTRVTRFPDGGAVLTRDLPGRSSVALGLWFAVGGRLERLEENGAAHFIEHMLFKGTRRRSAREISEAVEGLGGYLNAFTTEEATCFHARAKAEHLDTLFDVLADMVVNSRFDLEDVAKEREVIKEEISMYDDQPHQLVLDALNELMWPDHPLGRPLAGTRRSVSRLGRPELRRFMRRYYTAGALVVTAAGRVRHETVAAWTRRLRDRLPQRPASRGLPAGKAQRGPRVRWVRKDTEQTQLALGFRAYERGDRRRFALRLLSVLLGENMSSRLFQVIREECGLAYSIGTSVASFQDGGAFLITAGLDDRHVARALKLVLRVLQEFRERPPAEAALKRAKDYVLGQFQLSQESVENQMNWLGEHMLGFGSVPTEMAYERHYSAVRSEEVWRVAREVLSPCGANLALVAPRADPRELRKRMDDLG